MNVRVILCLVALLAHCEKEAEPVSKSDLPPVEVRTEVDKAIATTGDLITFAVVIEHDESIEVELPEVGARIIGFRVVDAGEDPLEQKRGRLKRRRWYKLRADLTGSYVLPAVQVSYETPPEAAAKPDKPPQAESAAEPPPEPDKDQPAESEPAPSEQAPAALKPADTSDQQPDEQDESRIVVEASEIFVGVKSVLPVEGEVTDIRDVKPLRRIKGRPAWPFLLGSIAVLAVVAAAIVWVQRRRHTKPASPPTPPHELAFAALNRLRGTDFNDPEALERYYFDISEVVRAYVEGRFALNATDLTTEEILHRVGEIPELGRDAATQLAAFLEHTDHVKFAGVKVGTEQISTTYEQALSFVEQTQPSQEMLSATGSV